MEVDRCRHAFPDLRILSGIELSEGHWQPAPVAELLGGFDLDRVVGSVHALVDLDARPTGSAHVEVGDGYAQRQPVEVVLAYLAEVGAMAASDAPFEVLGHIDYPLSAWTYTADRPSIARHDPGPRNAAPVTTRVPPPGPTPVTCQPLPSNAGAEVHSPPISSPFVLVNAPPPVYTDVPAGQRAKVADIVFCAVIEACRDAFDVRRAQGWTDAMTRWCLRA